MLNKSALAGYAVNCYAGFATKFPYPHDPWGSYVYYTLTSSAPGLDKQRYLLLWSKPVVRRPISPSSNHRRKAERGSVPGWEWAIR